MKKTGAQLVVYALEQVGVRWTFGIPGVHNTEIYDELNKSTKIEPMLVTHEIGASFMADGISRTSSSIGCMVIVPAAGVTHAMSGIGEAYLDGIPMLIITGGCRRDTGKSFQLHQLDQQKLVAAITKKSYVVSSHKDIIPNIYQAYEIATSGTPGPVFLEIPGELQLFNAEVAEMPSYTPRNLNPILDLKKVEDMAKALHQANKPAIYLGWGAREASEVAMALADILGAPVATTIQGLSVFPSRHPLHAGMGFGNSAVPASQLAFADCDCLLTVGARFGELATGSFGLDVPEQHLHIDINPEVFQKNYRASLTLTADAKDAMENLHKMLKQMNHSPKRNVEQLKAQIKEDKKKYFSEWDVPFNKDKVNPWRFFKSLRNKIEDKAFLVVDDGNHTFLSAELFPVYHSKHFISPTDFNAMGYCVPAAIACKLANPQNEVIGIVGDGAFLMTALELLTASTNNLGVVIMVFHDGELAQISQFQKIPLNRKTCTIIGDIKIEGVALATGAAFFEMNSDEQIDEVIDSALKISRTGRPVIVDIKIDYSKKTRFTLGAVKTNLGRFPIGEKVRFIGRAMKRHLLG